MVISLKLSSVPENLIVLLAAVALSIETVIASMRVNLAMIHSSLFIKDSI